MEKPTILIEGIYSRKDLARLKRKEIWKVADIYVPQLNDLFEINNPPLSKESKEYKRLKGEFLDKKLKDRDLKGDWIYYPWNGILLHIVNEDDLLKLKTNRNKNLITEKEQKVLYDSCVGILGLSVGSGLAVGLSYQGIAKDLKLAEFDTLETTNLNRVSAGLHQIGMRKIDIAVQKIWEINPYANLHFFDKGLTKNVLKNFIYKAPRPRVIFEIVDDFEMKVLVRIEAKKARIPVVAFANLGDSILADIDRYDLDGSLPLFNGLLGDFPEEILKMPDEDKNKYAVKMVGIENVPTRALESVKEIGKTLVGRPQLSSTVIFSGALGTYVTRQIVLGNELKSGRYLIKFEEFFK